jgi:hypothetical protein
MAAAISARLCFFPSRPDAPSDYPEKLIEPAEDRARMATFQCDELLTQSKILEKETSPPAKEAAQHSKAEPNEAKHGHDLVFRGGFVDRKSLGERFVALVRSLRLWLSKDRVPTR